MSLVLFDTNAVSEIRRGKNPHLVPRARQYLQQHGQFSFSIITKYELLRGMKVKHAALQIGLFQQFCQRCEVLPVTDAVIDRAADVYADLHRRGQLIGDADILIAATALEHGRTVVTANVGHFQRIPGLVVEDWTKP
jgi:tRNA(fMet)-specific endonuclease VapC